jgi:hypothetical protein
MGRGARNRPRFSIILSTATSTNLTDGNNNYGDVVTTTPSIREINKDLISVIKGILPNNVQDLVVLNKIVQSIRAQHENIPLLGLIALSPTLDHHLRKRPK